MRPLVLEPGYDAELRNIEAERDAFFSRLFSRWLELGWTIKNMRKTVSEQSVRLHPENHHVATNR